MKAIQVVKDRVRISERLAISFQRTLRIPEDDRVYPLPPTIGYFPIRRAEDYLDCLPDEWKVDELRISRGVFIPMHPYEAMWMAFEGVAWKPNAVKIGVGRINALTGEEWGNNLTEAPQNYIVCPDQPWLDGFNIGGHTIRQFVAAPLGFGETVEGQISGEEKFGGIQILVFEPVAGRFPDEKPISEPEPFPLTYDSPLLQSSSGMEFGMAAGGQVSQKIYPDRYGLATWEKEPSSEFHVWLVDSALYSQITGETPPPSPISVHDYTHAGLPWFEWYDEDQEALEGLPKLKKIKSSKSVGAQSGHLLKSDDKSVSISPDQIRQIRSNQDDRRL